MKPFTCQHLVCRIVPTSVFFMMCDAEAHGPCSFMNGFEVKIYLGTIRFHREFSRRDIV